MNKITVSFQLWLKQINAEVRTPDKFTQYFNNLNKLKFNSIPEPKGKQPPNNTESKILIQRFNKLNWEKEKETNSFQNRFNLKVLDADIDDIQGVWIMGRFHNNEIPELISRLEAIYRQGQPK